MGDAAGIILAGALVGAVDTRTPLVVNVIWSWALVCRWRIFLPYTATLPLERALVWSRLGGSGIFTDCSDHVAVAGP